MATEFWFKGLSAEDHHFGHTPAKSATLAKGTLYEAWFDTLQASPWYRDISATGIFLSEAAEENWKNFGDLKDLKFESWWRAKGYKLFAEKKPFRDVKEIKLKHRIDRLDDRLKPPVLILEIHLICRQSTSRHRSVKFYLLTRVTQAISIGGNTVLPDSIKNAKPN